LKKIKAYEILNVPAIAVKTVIRTTLRNNLYLIKEIAQLSNRSYMIPLPNSPSPPGPKT